ncbi:MAG: redox-sensing transcriptional repressor Rex [Thermoanaerobaculia bacterium]
MSDPNAVPPVTLNRLSIYLRCLRRLREEGVRRVSSQRLARLYRLSATQIRKDLTQFGEFGIRGVGYEVDQLCDRLAALLGVDRTRSIVVVGMGNLGSALACHIGFNNESFAVVGGFDNDQRKVGTTVGHLQITHISDLPAFIERTRAEIGVITVPALAAQRNYDTLVAAGVQAVLNFAPVRLKLDPQVPTKNVDLSINLEELGFFLRNGVIS